MKKVMMMMAFMLTMSATFANEIDFKTGPAAVVGSETLLWGEPEFPALARNEPCTISQKAKLDATFISFEVTCTVTKPTCKEAIIASIACIREAVAVLRAALL